MGAPVNNTIKITNEYSQLALEIEGGATTEGTRAEQYTDTGKNHQRWRLKPAGPGNEGFYNIENAHSAMSLEVVNSSNEPGADIVQRPYDPGPLHRQWKLVPVTGKENVYKIENRNSGLVLDGVDRRTDAPAPVKQYGSWNDDGRQQWKLIPSPSTPGQRPEGQPTMEIPVGEFIFINHLPSGQHLNSQGWVGNDGQAFLFHDRNILDWRGEEWVFENGPDGTYYINVGVAFDNNYIAVDPRRDSVRQIFSQQDLENYGKIYKTSKKKRLTFDFSKIPNISAMNFGNDGLRYPPLQLQRAIQQSTQDAEDQAQRWILRSSSGIQNSFSLHPASRDDLAVTPRNCLGEAHARLCLIPYEGYLSQLFTIAETPF